VCESCGAPENAPSVDMVSPSVLYVPHASHSEKINQVDTLDEISSLSLTVTPHETAADAAVVLRSACERKLQMSCVAASNVEQAIAHPEASDGRGSFAETLLPADFGPLDVHGYGVEISDKRDLTPKYVTTSCNLNVGRSPATPPAAARDQQITPAAERRDGFETVPPPTSVSSVGREMNVTTSDVGSHAWSSPVRDPSSSGTFRVRTRAQSRAASSCPADSTQTLTDTQGHDRSTGGAASSS
jgi:hypothetical protein